MCVEVFGGGEGNVIIKGGILSQGSYEISKCMLKRINATVS